MDRYKEELLDLLSQYKPYDINDKNSLKLTSAFLSSNEDVFGNTNSKGHITASIWLLDYHFEKVLMTHHKKLNKWLQLGGHTEIGESIHEAALREAMEESGLTKLEFLEREIFDVDVHEIPERKHLPAHFHYDVRFLIRQTAKESIMISDESNDLKWIPIEEVLKLTNSPSVLRMVEKTTGKF
ncbi:NUDIX hydrolase [Fusibacter bizertensis]|uniref:NUDIX hydrolase n=1 Tax=Fusibacter bizertensis TaxID=1488331 RepID=A0ABT6NA33_9FIRM|nr:NUDIX hydrolase [Fusibacter bizertensis]MDH8677266.1 NUDIX hydrolase [Fusibacter bizertensis]